MANYQTTPEEMDNYETAILARIILSTVTIDTKFVESLVSTVGSPPKLDII